MTSLRTGSLRLAHRLGFVLPLILTSSRLSAQTQPAVAISGPPQTLSKPIAPPALRFEVVSVRPHQPTGDDPSNRKVLPGGRFVATATTVRTLIRIAFGTDDNRMSGGPKWIDEEMFDIDGVTVNRAEVRTPQEFQGLILSLLEDRFQLKFHREEKQGAVYWLEVDKPGKLGSGLRVSGPDSVANMSTNSNGLRVEMKASKMSMADVAAALRRKAGRPVEDHTGLKGEYDFQVEWSPEETPDSVDPSLFTVLKERLGLKLRAAKGTTEMLVIERVERPSAN